jgi:hypothetical protein
VALRLDALPVSSSSSAKRRRGKQFESVLHDMFLSAGMEPRTSFRPSGEEIDGSFIYRGWPMLLEAKWTKKPIPASVLYQFRGKLDGKLVGTVGMFVSMGGYSKDAVDALVAGRSVNLILFDGEDMRKIAEPGCIQIDQAIGRKIRLAAELGTPFAPLPACPARSVPAAIVVEGPSDVAIMRSLLRTFRFDSHGEPAVIAAMGSLNLPLVALAQVTSLPTIRKLIIVADGDDAPVEVQSRLDEAINQADVASEIEITAIVISPNLATVLAAYMRQVSQQMAGHADERGLAYLVPRNVGLKILLQVLGILR